MLDKHINPPCDIWEDQDFNDWIDDLYKEWINKNEDVELHNYECRVFNELDRRIRV